MKYDHALHLVDAHIEAERAAHNSKNRDVGADAEGKGDDRCDGD